MTRAVALLLLLGASTVHAEATMSLRTEGGGFSDPTPASAIGGNEGTTLGEQRRIAVAYAVELWGKHLDSPVPIELRALFSYYGCGVDSAIVAAAFATEHLSLPGEDDAILYPSALADRLAGRDLSPGRPDIDMRLNADLDAACSDRLGAFYYGLDGNAPRGQIDLVDIALHELAHGLGFSSLIDPVSGVSAIEPSSSPFDQHVFDRRTQKLWSEMVASERRLSARSADGVEWQGEAVSALASLYLESRGDGGVWGVAPDGGVLLYTPSRVTSGSSVSHFDTSASPDLLMEPFARRDANHGLDLTVALLRDLGWGALCGDGVLDDSEQCDDGPANRDDGVAPCQSDCTSMMRAADLPTASVQPEDAGSPAPTDAATTHVDASVLLLDRDAEGCSLGGHRFANWIVVLLVLTTRRRRWLVSERPGMRLRP